MDLKKVTGESHENFAERRNKGGGQKCEVRSIMIHVTRKIMLGWANQENYTGDELVYTGVTWGMHETLGLETLKGIGHSGDQGVDRSIILKCIFKGVVCKYVDKIYST